MPATLTYNSLVSDMQTYSERSDANFVAQIPRLVMMAENRIATEAHILGYLTPMTGGLLVGQYAISKPNFWRETVSMNFTDANGNANQILPRSYEYCRNYWPNPNATKPPRYYADYDFGHWLVGPTPDQAYPAECLYYERLEPLSSSNQTNVLTDNAPQALIFGTLLQFQPFIKNDARIAVFQASYTDALGALKQEDVLRTGDRQAVALDS